MTILRQHIPFYLEILDIERFLSDPIAVFGVHECFYGPKPTLMNALVRHTPCNGYFNHGFHTFSPECLLQALELNGFSIKYLKFSTPDGIEVRNPGYAVDVLIWIVAERLTTHKEFIIPQQGRWKTYYE